MNILQNSYFIRLKYLIKCYIFNLFQEIRVLEIIIKVVYSNQTWTWHEGLYTVLWIIQSVDLLQGRKAMFLTKRTLVYLTINFKYILYYDAYEATMIKTLV